MPNWKKLIVSGSDANLNSLNTTANINVGGLLTIPGYILHTGNTGTAIGFDADNVIRLKTDSSTALQIDSSQNIKVVAGSLSISGDNSNFVSLTESGNGDFTINAPDDIRLDAGGNDIVLRGASSSEFGRLSNSSQNFIIKNITADKDIIFQADNGSGGVENYIQIDGSAGRTLFNKHIRVNDSVQVQFGNDADLQVYHDGSNSHLVNLTGNLRIRNFADNSDITFESDDGSGGTAEYFKLDGTNVRTLVSKPINLKDNVVLQLGDSQDLRIYHNGNNSYIQDAGVGSLKILAQDFDLTNAAESALMIRAIDGAQAELYYGGAKKLETTSIGAEVQGRLSLPGTNTFFIESNNTAATFNLGSSTRGYNFINSNATLLSLSSAGNATFAGDVNIGTFTSTGTTSLNLRADAQHDTTLGFFEDNANYGFSLNYDGGLNDFIVKRHDNSASGTPVLTLFRENNNATFAGGVTVEGGTLDLGKADTASGHINAKELMTFNIDTDNDDTNRYFAWYKDSSSGSGTELLKILETGAATFAGNVTIGSSATTDAKLNTIADGETTFFTKYKSTRGTGHTYGFKTNGTNSEVLALMDVDNSNRIAAFGPNEVSFNIGGNQKLKIDSAGNATFAGDVVLGTGDNLYLNGTTGLRLLHDGSNALFINQTTGDFKIQNSAADKDIVFRGQDGSSTIDALRLDMSDQGWAHFNTGIAVGNSGATSTFAGNVTVAGTLTAQEFKTEFVSASIVYQSGSTKFGDTADDVHAFTGSLEVTGSTIISNPAADATLLVLDSPASGVNVNFGFEVGDTGISGLHPKNLVIRGSSGASDIAFSPSTTYPGLMMLDGSTGKVGIGTTTPAANLHVYNAGTAMIRVDSDSTSPYKAGIEFIRNSINGGRIYNDGGAVQVKLESDYGYESSNPTRGGFVFKTAPVTSGTLVDAVRIDALGNVGIGTSSPSRKLHIETSGADGSLKLYQGTYQQFDFKYDEAYHSTMMFGHFGELQYDGNGGYLRLSNNSTQAGSHIALRTAGSERIRVTHDGKVGIGTSSPGAKLHVAGSIFAESNLVFKSTGAAFVEHSTTGQSLKFRLSNSSALDVIPLEITPSYMASTVNMYFGDSNKLILGAGSDLNIFHDGANSYFENKVGDLIFRQEADDKDIIFKSDNGSGGDTAYLTLDGSTTNAYFSNPGNVGIGTTTPTRGDLVVEGDFKTNLSGNGQLAVIGGVSGSNASGSGNGGQMVFGGSISTSDSTRTFGSVGGHKENDTSGNRAGYLSFGTRQAASPDDIFERMRISSIGAIKLNSYGSGTHTGTLAKTLGVDSSGNVIEFSGGAGGGAISSVTTGANNRVAVFAGSDSLDGDANFTWDGTKLGIGTSTPSFQVSIENHQSTTSIATMELDGKRTNGADGPVGEMIFSNNGDTFATVAGYRDGADNKGSLQFQTQDSTFTTKMTISSEGNVGIGTTNPTDKLNIVTGVGTFDFKDYNLTHSTSLGIRAESGYLGLVTEGADDVFLSTNGFANKRLTVKSDGKIGIGTTAPSTIFQVKSTGADDGFYLIKSDNTNLVGGIIQTGTGDGALILRNTSNANTVLLRGQGNNYINGGNLGIGTSSPTTKLDVRGSMIVAGDTPPSAYGATLEVYRSGSNSELLIHQDDASSFTKYAQLHFRNGGNDTYIKTPTSGQALIIDTESVTNAIGIRTDGRVGIGTITPSDALQIKGDGKGFYISSADYNVARIIPRGTGANLDKGLLSLLDAGVEDIRIDAGGHSWINTGFNLGIGTGSPAYTLDVNGDIQNNGVLRRGGNVYIKSTGSDTAIGPAGAGTITFHTSSILTGTAEAMRIDADGNLLLNNTSAGARLDIREDSNYAIRAEDASGHYFRVNTGGNTEIRGNLTVGGVVTAQEFHTEFVSASIVYESGSTKFGDTQDDDHDFTGSLNVSGSVHLSDSSTLKLGNASGGDLQLYHNGSHSLITNQTGNLYIRNQTNDGKVYFQADDGNGNDTNYFYLDGTRSDGTNFATRFPDQSIILLGSGTGWNDGSQIYHNGSNFFLNEYVGNINFTVHTDDGDIVFNSDDGSGGVTQFYRVDGGANLNVFSKDIFLADNKKALFGSNSDLKIYHDGTDSIIQNYVGSIYIDSNADDQDIVFRNDDGSGGLTDYLRLDGSARSIVVSAALGMYFNDGIAARFGNAGDMHLYHNGTHSFISNNTGDLNLHTDTGTLYLYNNADDGDISFQSDNGSGGITEYFRLDGGEGITIASRDIRMIDNKGFVMGTDGDSFIKHTGAQFSFFNDTGHAIFYNRANDKDFQFHTDDGSGGTTAYLTLNGSNTHAYFSNPGNVGIGTTSPGYKLEVAGTARITGALTFGGNVNNIIYGTGSSLDFKSNGEYYFRKGANTNLTILSNGNVGIGTTTPGAKLHLQSSENAATSNLLYLENIGSGGSEGVSIKFNPTFDAESMIASNREGAHANVSNLTFHTYSGSMAEAMRITSAGNVGIGTTDPGTDNLRVSGTGRVARILATNDSVPLVVQNTSGATARIGFKGTTSTSDYHVSVGANGQNYTVYTDNAERMRITSGGNVGIGTTSPGAPLDVKSNSASSADSGIRLIAAGSSDVIAAIGEKSTNGGRFHLYDGGAAKVSFYSDGTSNYIAAGNVGIGTTNPGYKLDVESSANILANFESTTNKGAIRFSDDDTVGYISAENGRIGFGTSPILSTANITMLTSNYNVGIGTTSPSKKLTVKDTQYQLQLAGDNNYWNVGAGWTNYYDGSFLIGNNTGDKFVISSTGNVGIGTTSPSAKFNVQGSATIGWNNLGNALLLAGTTSSGIGIDTNEIANKGDHLYVGTIDAKDIIFRTNGANARLTIASNGTSTFTGNVTINGSSTLGDSYADTTTIGLKHLLGYSQNVDLDTGTEDVSTLPLATYQAVFFDYVIKNGTNLRAGTVTAVHDGTNVEFTETSTKDLGDTSGVTLSVDISGSNMRLRATTTSDNWIVKANIRGIKV